MKIENLVLDDIPQIVELGAVAHSESKYSHLPYSPNAVSSSFYEHINDPEALAVKLVEDGIVGFFIGYKTGFIFTDVPIALETCYYIKPEHRGSGGFKMLIDAFIDWAGSMPQITNVHFKEDNSLTFKALEKMGFKQIGSIFGRNL